MKAWGRTATAGALLAVVLGAIAATGCTSTVGYAGNAYSWNGKGELSGKYYKFNGTRDYKISTDSGDTIHLTYGSEVSKGELDLWIRDPAGNKTKLETGTQGELDLTSTGGTYRVYAEGHNAGGRYSYEWKVEHAQ